MRILFLTRWYPSRDHMYAGIFVREHAKAVRAAGHEVVVVHIPGVARVGHGLWHMEAEGDPQLSEGIPTYHVYQRPMKARRPAVLTHSISYLMYLWSAVRAAHRLRCQGFRPDVIHANVYSAGVPAILLGKLFGRPVVVTEHFTGFHSGSMGRGEWWKARFAFEHASRVLPVCDYLQQAISRRIHARFQIVPNAVDTSIFHMAGSPRRDHEPKRFIFVGNLEPTNAKGFPTLVDAMSRLRERRADWHLDVVGQGLARPESERLVAAAGLAESVTFHGALPKARVAEMMRASDVFVLPSRFENLPCVIIEAMASGLPVVATTVGGIPEMVSDADEILIPRDDPAALADAMDRALSALGSFDRAGIETRAQARFSLEAVGQTLSAVYSSVRSQ